MEGREGICRKKLKSGGGGNMQAANYIINIIYLRIRFLCWRALIRRNCALSITARNVFFFFLKKGFSDIVKLSTLNNSCYSKLDIGNEIYAFFENQREQNLRYSHNVQAASKA